MSMGKILIVDDDDIIIGFLKEAAKRLGFDVLSAMNGPEALLLAEEEEDIRLVITDVVMPGMNGNDLYYYLKRTLPEVPVLFVSGFSQSTLKDSGFDSQKMFFLPKPFNLEDLRDKVEEILDN